MSKDKLAITLIKVKGYLLLSRYLVSSSDFASYEI